MSKIEDDFLASLNKVDDKTKKSFFTGLLISQHGYDVLHGSDALTTANVQRTTEKTILDPLAAALLSAVNNPAASEVAKRQAMKAFVTKEEELIASPPRNENDMKNWPLWERVRYGCAAKLGLLRMYAQFLKDKMPKIQSGQQAVKLMLVQQFIGELEGVITTALATPLDNVTAQAVKSDLAIKEHAFLTRYANGYLQEIKQERLIDKGGLSDKKRGKLTFAGTAAEERVRHIFAPLEHMIQQRLTLIPSFSATDAERAVAAVKMQQAVVQGVAAAEGGGGASVAPADASVQQQVSVAPPVQQQQAAPPPAPLAQQQQAAVAPPPPAPVQQQQVAVAPPSLQQQSAQQQQPSQSPAAGRAAPPPPPPPPAAAGRGASLSPAERSRPAADPETVSQLFKEEKAPSAAPAGRDALMAAITARRIN